MSRWRTRRWKGSRRRRRIGLKKWKTRRRIHQRKNKKEYGAEGEIPEGDLDTVDHTGTIRRKSFDVPVLILGKGATLPMKRYRPPRLMICVPCLIFHCR